MFMANDLCICIQRTMYDVYVYNVQCTRTYDVQRTFIISYNEHHLVIITYKCKINMDLYYAHKFTLLYN